MSGRVSLVLVTFRSAAVVGDAVASFRAELAACRLEGEVVLVDHSEDEAEAARLRPLADRLLVRPNRGYAAGINAGVAAAAGDTVLAGNPDVRFAVGSLAALLAALDGGWDVVGPQFVLAGLLLAPADEQGPAAELRRLAAGRWCWAWHRLLRREVGRWLAVWRAATPVAAGTLSGALLAARAATWRRFGAWDEGYFLYFEETDWLRRVRRAGGRVGLVPGARVTHLWGHAAEPGANAHHFAASRARFLGRHFGLPGRALARVQPRPARVAALPPRPAAGRDDGDLLWLVSPSGDGLHAATPAPGAGALPEVVEAAVAERGRATPVALVAWDTRRRRAVALRRAEV